MLTGMSMRQSFDLNLATDQRPTIDQPCSYVDKQYKHFVLWELGVYVLSRLPIFSVLSS